jgi:UDP-N-acetylglucosamine--N-acetylmuramyl-(pentapeptide) pyrophosphoryl-undecaprenol N-acetylglucosamine transferase
MAAARGGRSAAEATRARAPHARDTDARDTDARAMTSVVIAAGGTSGHLVPALAIAEAIRRAEPDARVSFVGARRGFEREMIPAAGYPIHLTSVRPFARTARGAVAATSLVPAVAQARAALRAERADVVAGMGGYPSVPAVIAARMSRIPSVIHEQNAVPGLANELAARFTRNVAVSFPPSLERFRDARLVGLPLREAFARFDRDALRAEARAHFGLDPTRKTVLVFGGSLGAARLNDAAAELAARWRARADVQILLAAGRARTVPALDEPARVVTYIERMDLAYAAADVVVARAGASTVAELAATATPSLLVPLPVARRKEQHANARVLAEPGGALVLDDAAVAGESLDAALSELLADRAKLDAMSAAARTVARPGAADEMARWILELARG